MPGNSDIILGIDLGTTFSAMSYVDRFGKSNIIPNADGHSTTPSVIHFYDRNACVVGEEAVKMVVVDPANVVRFIKRAMGDTDFVLDFFGESYTPQELSAFILRKLKADAEEALGKEIKDAVITVPAYFNSAQRGATAEAGEIAGFNVLSIINEPTAAAIALGLDMLGGNRRLLVFDLGGGTFDVTVMEIRGTTLRTLASDGNAELGGKDWDDRLLTYVAEQFRDKFNLDPRDDPLPYQELYERCLHAKISLSTKPRAVIPVNFRGHRMVVSVTREEFNALCSDLVEQCSDTCSIVLKKAGMRWEDIDEVLLVGGSTRMPMIKDMLLELSGRPLSKAINPDEGVALGAALAGVFRHQPNHPAMQVHRRKFNRPGSEGSAEPMIEVQSETDHLSSAPAKGLQEIKITDAATHSLGIIVLDAQHNERVIKLIPASTPLPVEKRGRFAYAYDNMTAVRVEVTEGEGGERHEVTVIGEVILDNLPPRVRGTPIDVVYRYTENNILEVDVIDVETRAVRRAKLNLRGSLDRRQLERARNAVARAQIN
ncbi:MAG: Hsp70 family protein [Alphaproteobacteria bacterium]|nr:Hsp70 family protein [Alphaproteobacteria bacterium]MCB9791643.1 Hsp70 family protein [Alphaproteobacteria bacterium]